MSGPGTLLGARTLLLRARTTSSRAAWSLAAFSSAATGVWGFEPQPHPHPLPCSLCCSAVSLNILDSPFWFFVCRSLSRLVFQTRQLTKTWSSGTTDVVIPQCLYVGSLVQLTDLVKNAHQFVVRDSSADRRRLPRTQRED
jgi:hypothetical protein